MSLFGRFVSAVSDRVVNAGIWCEEAFFAAMSSFRAWRARRRAHPIPQPQQVPAQPAPAPAGGALVFQFPGNGRPQQNEPSTIKIEGTPEQLRDFISGLTAAGGTGAGGQQTPAADNAAATSTGGGSGQPPQGGWLAVLAALGRGLRNVLGWPLRHPTIFATLIAAALMWFWLVPWVKGFFTLAPPGPIVSPPSASTPGATPQPVQPPAGGGLAPPAPLTPPSGGLAPPAPIPGGTPPASQPAQPPAAAGGGLQPPAPIDGGGGLNPPAPIDGAKRGEIKPPAAAVEGGKPPPSPSAEKARATERTLPDGTIERVFPDGTIERHKKPTR